MTAKLSQIIQSIAELSADERALLAHCLLASLQAEPAEHMDTWLALAEQRFVELEAGKVQGLSWPQIKATLQG